MVLYSVYKVALYIHTCTLRHFIYFSIFISIYCLFTVDNITMDFTENSSSDDDDPFDMIGMGGRRGGTDRDGDTLGEVYPYAWALDGRRIGENTPVVRPSSPTSSFVSS